MHFILLTMLLFIKLFWYNEMMVSLFAKYLLSHTGDKAQTWGWFKNMRTPCKSNTAFHAREYQKKVFIAFAYQ